MPFSRKELDYRSLLERDVSTSIPYFVTAYIIIQALFQNAIYNHCLPSCEVPLELPEWVQALNFGCGFGLFCNATLHLFFSMKFFARKGRNCNATICMHLSTMVVHVIAGSSQFLTYFGNRSVYVDGFGVYSIGHQWPEWIVSVPLLAYLACSVVSKPNLSGLEWIFLANIVCMILFGFLIVVNPERKVAYFVMSILNYMGIPVISYLMDKESSLLLHTQRLKSTSPAMDTAIFLIQQQVTWRRKILERFFGVCTIFPIVYILQAVKVIPPSVGCAGFLLGSMVGKLMFSASMVHSHSNLSRQSELVTSCFDNSNETRRAFLRYVFHELRAPLNSLAVGLQLMTDSFGLERLSPQDKQLLEMMQCSASGLVDNVNQVLMLHRIREGELRFINHIFHTSSWFEQVFSSAQNIFLEKSLRWNLFYDKECPSLVFGDPDRWQLIIHSLLSSISTCVQTGGQLEIKVSSRPPTDFHCRSSPLMRNFTRDVYNAELLSDVCDSDSTIMEPVVASIVDVLDVVLSSLLSVPMTRSRKQDDASVYDYEDGFADIYVSFLSKEFVVSPSEMTASYEPFQNLRTADQQREHGTGLGFVLASEMLQLLPGSSMHILSPQGKLLQEVTLRLHVPTICVDDVVSGKGSELSVEKKVSKRVHARDSFGSQSSQDIENIPPVPKTAYSESNLFGHLRSAGRESPVVCPSSSSTSPNRIDSCGVSKSDSFGSQDKILQQCIDISMINNDCPEVGLSRDTSLTFPEERVATKAPAGVNSSSEPPPNSFPTTAPSQSLPRQLFSSNNKSLLGGLHILVVDDTPSNSKILVHALSRRRCTCDTAENGQIALDMVLANPSKYDLIFMDHTMPIMTGTQATAHIRSAGYLRYIIGITGNVLDDDITAFLLAGANMVLLKPLRLQEMDLVLQHIQRTGLETTAENKLCIGVDALEQISVKVPSSRGSLLLPDDRDSSSSLSTVLDNVPADYGTVQPAMVPL